MKTKWIQLLGRLGLLLSLTAAQPLGATVGVYGVASSSGEFVTVQVYADIATVPIVSYSARVYYDPGILRVLNATRNNSVWRLFDGVRSVSYIEPDASTSGQVLMVGARLEAHDPLGGVEGDGVLLGTIVFARLRPTTPAFNLTLGRTGVYANFVTATGVRLEALPGEVIFNSVRPTRDDEDLDGLTDRWEVEHFKDIRLAFYSDDPDRDGANNLAEEAMGSDPNDRNSNLKLTLLRRGEELRLQWTSFETRTYAVESAEDLRMFKTVAAGLRATPPLNTLDLRMPPGSRATFYRIRLEP